MGAAATALNERSAMGAANQRQMAMQNDPSKSPTTFQQLQAREQALAQKEQQLGVMGALMAKKAQDLQVREQGIAALPVPQDMFTAMNGGIVFNRGGSVEGYASRGLVADEEFRMANVEPQLLSGEDLPELDPLQKRIAEMRAARDRRVAGLRDVMLSPEQKEEIERKERERLAEQYRKYKEGISGLDEETAAAIRGKPADMWKGIAAGLPTDLRGMRLAGGIASIAKGIAGERGKAEDREREAAKYLADAKRKGAAADLAEQRNQDTLARQLRKSEQDDKLKADELLGRDVASELEMLKGVAGLEEQRAERGERREDRRLTREQADRAYALDLRKYEEAPGRAEALAKLEAKLRREGRVPTTEERIYMNATLGMDKDEIAAFSKGLLESRGGRGGAGADGRPTYDQVYDNALKRFQGMNINKIITAAAKDPKNPRTLTENDVFNMVLDEEFDRIKQRFGDNSLRGQGGRGSTPAGGASGKVDMDNPLLKP
jgi:hypothetical protein